METKPVKANLFRFVTLRNPQLIEEKDKDPGFIFHPEGAPNQFYSAIEGLEDDAKEAALQSVSDSFSVSAYKTKNGIRKNRQDLYDFSSWLMKNKNALTFKSIKDNKGNAFALSAVGEITTWENLIYQTVSQTSVYVREACIQLLIADKFLQVFNKMAKDKDDDYVFTESELKEFTRRAHASVVISKMLFSSSSSEVAESTYQPIDEKALSNLKATAAKHNKAAYSSAKDELKKAEVSYNKDYQDAYDAALEKHNTDVEALIAAAKPTIVERVDELGNTTQIETYPDLELPKFEFDFNTAIDEAYLGKKVSVETLGVFNGLELDSRSKFSEIFTAIDTHIKAENQTISKNRAAQKKQVVKVKGGKFTSGKSVTSNPYCFTATLERFSGVGSGILMGLNTDYPNASVTSGTYQLMDTTNTSTVINGIGTMMLPSDLNNNTINVFFKFPSPLNIDPYTNIIFSGEYTLDNGNTYIFSVRALSGPKGNLSFTGCSKLVADNEGGGNTGNPTPSPVKPSVNGNIYGVSKLGIADFRRVEQEVCCYVPGEVSHIENVMAREYKERSTRSLVSSEITNEQTDERERENLTDTTTTERNEMQSEVSQVLNEDQAQSFGANANVSSTFGLGSKNSTTTVNAGAFFDSSSASSSSNSNSQAQTYAQEVTERAMERIVQKTQTKRTSRILKEFEENNSHGFDNRKGDEHISGVYRWVDKIYKNSLINYGKRLMYEFAIPEPSKFFKQAIIKAVEERTTDSAVILPTAPEHPSTQGINQASDLDENNYQFIASLYNADVKAKPKDSIVIGKAFSSTTTVNDGQEYREVLNFDEDFKVPEGYITQEAKVSCRVPEEGNLGGKVIIGTATFDVSGYWSASNNPNFKPIGAFENNVPISFSSVGFHAANVGVEIKCHITTQGEETWQNETYNAIMEAYNDRLREYNEAVQAEEVIPDGTTETLRFNPLENRAIEKREIKRIAIELLAAQKGHTVSRDNYKNPNASGISKVNKTADLNVHAATVKFFEQAFDWEIMAYTFYPYFYGNEADWEDLFQQQDAADPIFQAFLQSGMARSVVPVRQGFEDAVNWYMETGEIWNGQGLVVDTEDELYLSIAEEMQTVEGKVEDTWETRLPTSLTVIQAGSIGLNVEGLPCNTDCDDFKLFDSDGNEILDENGESFTNPIQQTNAQLESAGGIDKFRVS